MWHNNHVAVLDINWEVRKQSVIAMRSFGTELLGTRFIRSEKHEQRCKRVISHNLIEWVRRKSKTFYHFQKTIKTFFVAKWVTEWKNFQLQRYLLQGIFSFLISIPSDRHKICLKIVIKYFYTVLLLLTQLFRFTVIFICFAYYKMTNRNTKIKITWVFLLSVSNTFCHFVYHYKTNKNI